MNWELCGRRTFIKLTGCPIGVLSPYLVFETLTLGTTACRLVNELISARAVGCWWLNTSVQTGKDTASLLFSHVACSLTVLPWFPGSGQIASVIHSLC